MNTINTTTQVPNINTVSYFSKSNEEKQTLIDTKNKEEAEKTEKTKETDNVKVLQSKIKVEEEGNIRSKESMEKEKEVEKAISEAFLKNLKNNVEMIHKVGLNFSLHDSTGKTMIKVMDRNTDELIREIPTEEFLDFAAKMDEFVGLLFDKKA